MSKNQKICIWMKLKIIRTVKNIFIRCFSSLKALLNYATGTVPQNCVQPVTSAIVYTAVRLQA